jgi:hypothetical protein
MSAYAFSQRLNLLETSSQLAAETRRRVEVLIERTEAEFNIDLDEGNGSMFVTHVAIAWEKLRRGEVLPPAPQSLLDEVAEYVRERDFLENTFDELSGAEERIPAGELAFWTAHLVAVMASTPPQTAS